MAVISTPITELFGIKHPILLAGMNVAAGPELAAAVSNAGGLGVIGGLGYTPKFLREQIRAVKDGLVDKSLPFGVDLLIPQVGGSARKTNYDYTKGKLAELIEVIIEEKTSLFVCAVGVPPKSAVDRLHKARIPIMNMVGHPKHVEKALAAGVDIMGGHTGDIPASILIPACVDAVKGHKSPLNGKPVYVIGAGAVYDGRGLAANLMWGAQARFVAAVEAGATPKHKELIVSAGFEDAVTTLIYTGRPARVRRTEYVENWNTNRQAKIKELTSQGKLPHEVELVKHPEMSMMTRPWPMGRISSLINDVLPAKVIVDNMVSEAADMLQRGNSMLTSKSKL
ncbi:2-nitropropane dioxygenase [Mycena rebaudengoi]|nr:2-nitropropane dioxygenase [Mycena rebaudengoi]